MKSDIIKLIEERINPALANHNGSCEVSDYKDGIVFLKLHGQCKGCSGKQQTIKQGILPVLQESYPEIINIQIV